MTYLSNKFCKQIIKKSIATSIKLLCELDECKTLANTSNQNTIYYHDKINAIQQELICINGLLEATNKYMDATKFN